MPGEPAGQRALAVFFCLLALAWAAAAGWRGDRRVLPEHDEAITFLAAHANEAVYSAATDGAVHERGSMLRPLWENQAPVSFRQIERDLGENDIHPPGYFFVLGKWLNATKSDIASAVRLNIFFALAAAGLLGFSLRRDAGLGWAAATGAACAWLWLPATLDTTLFVRQYMLTALMLLATWQLWLSHVQKPEWQTLLAIVLLQAGTLLVSYQAASVIVIANVLATAMLAGSGQRRSAAWLLAGALVSLFLLWLANPHIVAELGRQQVQAAGDSVSMLQRSKIALDGLLQIPFYVTSSVAAGIKLAARLAGVLSVLWILWLGLKQLHSSWNNREFSAGLFGLLVPLLAIGAHVLLFLLGKLPGHAMGLRYLTVYTPMLFLGVAPLLRNALQARPAGVKLAAAGIAVAMLIGANIMFWAEQERRSVAEAAESRLLEAPGIVTDTVRRGLLPRFIWIKGAGEAQKLAAISPPLLPKSFIDVAEFLPARITVIHSTYYRKDTEGMAKPLLELVQQYGYQCEPAQVFSYGEFSSCRRGAAR